MAVLALVAACGSSGSAPARDVELQTTFRVEAGQERYECYRQNVDHDVFVTKLETSAALGVHHQILAISEDQSEPEGAAECSSILLDVSKNWLFLANSSPLSFAMPSEVAYKVSAGSQLLLQTHLFNVGESAIESTLTVHLTGIAESEVGQLAQLVEAGSLQIDLPPHQTGTVKGKCTLPEDVSVFGVLPHMHFMGTTFKATIGEGDSATTIYDGAFRGEAQQFTKLEPVAMPAGTTLNVQCDFFNTTDNRIIYGSSARDEMCFAITYYYPAIEGHSPLCIK